jgi:hypothetical protein
MRKEIVVPKGWNHTEEIGIINRLLAVNSRNIKLLLEKTLGPG